MTLEIAIWILGVAIVPLLGWCIWLTLQIITMNQMLIKLLKMHEHPEGTGFGTAGFAEIIEHNTVAIKALTHYVKWLAAQQGLNPPPPLVE